MSTQTFCRCGVALLLAAIASGCSLMGKSSERSSDCTWNRSSCLYEGKYEAGEEGYAEQEAKRLNQAQSAKLRRGSW